MGAKYKGYTASEGVAVAGAAQIGSAAQDVGTAHVGATCQAQDPILREAAASAAVPPDQVQVHVLPSSHKAGFSWLIRTP